MRRHARRTRSETRNIDEREAASHDVACRPCQCDRICGLMAVHGLAGYPVVVAPRTGLTVAVTTLHLVAAGLWVGGLVALLIGLPQPGGSRAESVYVVRTCLRRFGRIAAASVGLLAATRFYYAGRQVTSLDALATTV